MNDSSFELLIGYYFENFKFEDRCVLLNYYWLLNINFDKLYYICFEERDGSEVKLLLSPAFNDNIVSCKLSHEAAFFISENIMQMAKKDRVHDYLDFFYEYTLMISKDEYDNIF